MTFWRENKPPLVCRIKFFTKTNMVTITTIRLVPITASISVVRILKIPKNRLLLSIECICLRIRVASRSFFTDLLHICMVFPTFELKRHLFRVLGHFWQGLIVLLGNVCGPLPSLSYILLYSFMRSDALTSRLDLIHKLGWISYNPQLDLIHNVHKYI